jgi:HSP20 family molecular chaperone IbpA
MERNMADTAIEVKKTTPASAASAPAPAKTPDVWSSLRGEMDRVFDRFAGAFAMPSLRRMFDFEPARRIESTFTLTVPAIDVAENDKTYKVTAELPGMEAKNVDVTVSGDMLTIKGEKRQEKEEKEENYLPVRALFRLVPALVHAAGRRGSRQDQLRAGERRADDNATEDGRGAAAAEEDRGQGRLTATPRWGRRWRPHFTLPITDLLYDR